jgi:hypothetical protein
MLTFKNDYLRIIDFKNVVFMNDKYISIMFNNYFVKIQGSNLFITFYGYKEIIIKGTINNIEFN